MADFDQLIKEKMEKAQYAYSPSAWRSFAKSAGVRAGLSGLQIAAIAVAVVALVIGITLSVVFLGQPTPNSEQGAVVMIQDTAETQNPASQPTSNPQLPTSNPQQPTASDRVQNSESKVQGSRLKVQSSTPNSQPPTPNSQPPISNPQQPIYGRPLEILVDTITQMEPTDEQLRQGNSRVF